MITTFKAECAVTKFFFLYLLIYFATRTKINIPLDIIQRWKSLFAYLSSTSAETSEILISTYYCGLISERSMKQRWKMGQKLESFCFRIYNKKIPSKLLVLYGEIKDVVKLDLVRCFSAKVPI